MTQETCFVSGIFSFGQAKFRSEIRRRLKNMNFFEKNVNREPK